MPGLKEGDQPLVEDSILYQLSSGDKLNTDKSDIYDMKLFCQWINCRIKNMIYLGHLKETIIYFLSPIESITYDIDTPYKK